MCICMLQGFVWKYSGCINIFVLLLANFQGKFGVMILYFDCIYMYWNNCIRTLSGKSFSFINFVCSVSI